MSRQIRGWAWGLLPLALVAVATLALRLPEIPRELADQSNNALAEKGYAWAGIEVFGRDVTLTGTVPDEDSLAGAVATLTQIRGARHVSNATTDPPVASPFEWSMEHDEDTVTLSGHVPSARLREDLGEAVAAAFPDKSLNDNMNYARGVSGEGSWARATELIISASRHMAEGQAEIRDEEISLSGRAADVTAYDALPELLSSPPAGYRLAEMKIDPARVAPHRFEARLEQGGISFAGHVPSEHSATFARREAENISPDRQIADETAVAEGRVGESDWVAAARYGLGRLVLLADGARLSIVDREIEIDGQAADARAYEALLAGSNSEPPGFSVSFAIQPPSATLR